MSSTISGSSSSFYPSGSVEIDSIRKGLSAYPTESSNYTERYLMLILWLGALQQQGADTRPFFDIDRSYSRLQSEVNRAEGGDQFQSAMDKLCEVIDQGYQVMESIQKDPRDIRRPPDPVTVDVPGSFRLDWDGIPDLW